MADIELVIKIPKELYKNIQERSTEIQAEGYVLENAVLNGTSIGYSIGECNDFKSQKGDT